MPFVENVERLEKELGKPVIAALPAIIWNCLTTLKLRERVTMFGCLLKSLS
jgi:maleate cis-trans isomerase